MPATVLLDCIDGAYTDNQIGERVHRRMAVVKDIPVGSINGTDPNVLIHALSAAGMPQINDYHPSGDGTKVIRHRVTSVQANNQARVEIYYSNGNFANAQTGYRLRESSVGTSTQTQYVPGTGDPIRASWANPGDPSDTVPERSMTITYRQPIQQITAELDNAPASTINLVRSYVGRVNSVAWMNLPPAYWLLDGVETESTLRGASTKLLSVRFVSRVVRDWSESEHLSHNGIPVYVAPKDVTDLLNLPYKYGLIGKNDKGVARVGPYVMANFSALTGIV